MTTNTQSTTLPLSQLKVDPANVRKHSNVAIDEMMSMIRARGIIQPLRVRPNGDGNFMVTAGGRRYAALAKLAKLGDITADTAVPVLIGQDDSDDDATEISLMENVGRVAMSPVEEFEAFDKVRKAGATVADIALRFGKGERHVRQRLALAALDKSILSALRKGEIGLDVAQAFTVTSDAKTQRAVFKDLQGTGYVNAAGVRRMLTDGKLDATSKLAKTVGEEAYVAAGGTITDDLFADGRHWDDAGLAYRLAREALADKVEALKADGWSWVSFADELPEEMGGSWNWTRIDGKPAKPTKEEAARIKAITARLQELQALYQKASDADDEFPAELDREWDDLEEERAELSSKARVFTAAQKATAGVVVDIEGAGFTYGVLMPADAKRLRKEAADKAKAKIGGDDADAGDAKPALSASLMQDMTAQANVALQKAVEADPELALSILVAHVSAGYAQPYCVGIRFEGVEDAAAEESFVDTFKRVHAMRPASRLKLLAKLVAGTLRTNCPGDPTQDEDHVALYDAALPDVAKHVTIDAASYFARVTKDRCYQAINEVQGDPDAFNGFKHAKKGELAEIAGNMVKGTRWLPPELRFASYDGPAVPPKPAAKTKGKKS